MFEQVYDFENLYEAYQKAKIGKRWKNNTCRFEVNALEAIVYLQHLLKTKRYSMDDYNIFKIHEPKERLVKSLPFKDKVVQHALCDNIIEPIFERHYIYDNYACRKGKGVHAGLDRLSHFMRGHFREYGTEGWVLKCDIKKYFDSVDHEILRRKVAKLIPDNDVMWLINMIIDSTEGPGLPIGNLTSQHFSLIYLSDFDHFIKEKLRIKRYIRYMDDFVLIDADKEYLAYCKQEIIRYLDDLKLQLHPKSNLFPLRDGVNFLGFRSYMTETGKVVRKVRRDSKKRMNRKLKKFKRLYKEKEITKEQIDLSFHSWSGHAEHGNSYHLIQDMRKKYNKIFEEDKICRDR